MNNPFDYTPSDEMLLMQQYFVEQINNICSKDAVFAEEIGKGKMFGILRTAQDTLYAFSGQVCGSFHYKGFVPPVFDYLQPDGYFKQEEARIVEINKQIDAIKASKSFLEAKESLSCVSKLASEDITSYREQIKAEKAIARIATPLEAGGLSQFLNAELHRKKIYWREQVADKQSVVDDFECQIRELKFKRQHKSEQLQQWLFDNTILTNYKNEKRSLSDIATPLGTGGLVCSGIGDCCEPKLLNYAYTHNIEPIEIGTFWWGDSPKGEIRHHLHFYPACQGRCKLILPWQLPPLNGIKVSKTLIPLSTLYIDDDIIVINKPSGLLSVPGKSATSSALSILSSQFSSLNLFPVHRLDMDTSGIMVFARNKEAHKNLQRQFAEHTIVKHYHALLERPIEGEGRIELPLSPDYLDRPRQKVDYEDGKPAITLFKSLGDNLVELTPLTGRTHQLRVHCAHKEGLNNPIQGDRLYASERVNSRLMLDAYSLEFTHPRTGKKIMFTVHNF